MLIIKAGPTGCRIAGLQLQAWIAVYVCTEVYKKYNQDFTWTCGIDSKHMPGSLHYVGLAIDGGLPTVSEDAIVTEIRHNLGDDYDVVEEHSAVGGPHIHIEFQPKRGVNL
jgi:hypothetical protein